MPSHAYIVSYRETTNQAVIDQHIREIETQGGKIQHQYDTS